MPDRNHSHETATSPPSPSPPLDEEKADDSEQGRRNHNNELLKNSCDSDGSTYSNRGEKDEFIVVKLAEIRKEVECPICLGIIRKTRTVMECIHRFCRECIDKSMRLGNNECPACRAHCASRRSLRDDPNFDALIAVLYPDIDKYEEEELKFHEDKEACSQQIKASIAQTFRRRTEALGKKRTSIRTPTAKFVRRRDNFRKLSTQRNHRAVENQGSNEEETNAHDGSKDSSSADERSAEVKFKRCKRWGGTRPSQQSSGANADGGSVHNDSEAYREDLGTSAGLASKEFIGWGKCGVRSNTRKCGKLSSNNRLSKLINHLQSSNEITESKISLMLVSLHEETMASLQRPYLCYNPKSSVEQLCRYIAMQTSVEAREIEILMIKKFHPFDNASSFKLQTDNVLQMLNDDQILGDVLSDSTQENLVLGYRKKEVASEN